MQVVSVNPPQYERCHWGDEIEVRAHVRLGDLEPGDVACEIYMGPLSAAGDFSQRTTLPMEAQGGKDGVFEFVGTGRLEYTGRMGIKVRVVPFHPRLSSPLCPGPGRLGIARDHWDNLARGRFAPGQFVINRRDRAKPSPEQRPRLVCPPVALADGINIVPRSARDYGAGSSSIPFDARTGPVPLDPW